MLKESIAKRHDAFIEGLLAAGYAASCGYPKQACAGDVLLLWNRRGEEEKIADKFENAGGSVLVAENCYVGHGYYALARRYHNGGGEELIDDPNRVEKLGVEISSWRSEGGHVLVCPNRFIGPRRALMPSDWADQTALRIRALTGREARVRPHPGRLKNERRSLLEDLAGAWACVVWWSTAGVTALLAGVPVIYRAPWWIASIAAGTDLDQLVTPRYGDREAALRRIANSQFTAEEIASGLPFMGIAQ